MDITYLSGYIQRGEQIAVGLALDVAMLSHLIVVELHMLIAESDAYFFDLALADFVPVSAIAFLIPSWMLEIAAREV